MNVPQFISQLEELVKARETAFYLWRTADSARDVRFTYLDYLSAVNDCNCFITEHIPLDLYIYE